MKVTIEVNDDDVRRLFAELLERQPPSMGPAAPSGLLTVRDVAAELRVSRSKAYELINRGDIGSIAVGKTKRVAAAALAQFIARPLHSSTAAPHRRHRLSRPAVEMAAPGPPNPGSAMPRLGRSKRPEVQIDLSARPITSRSFRPQMTDAEWDAYCGRLSEKGWPSDVVDQIRADRSDAVERVYVLTVGETAKYLCVSRTSVDKLIKSGKLRLVTIAPAFSDEKPAKWIPAVDILALTEGN